jgi:hypothetical protein
MWSLMVRTHVEFRVLRLYLYSFVLDSELQQAFSAYLGIDPSTATSWSDVAGGDFAHVVMKNYPIPPHVRHGCWQFLHVFTCSMCALFFGRIWLR